MKKKNWKLFLQTSLWAQKFKIVVVVSAFSGTTDQLIQVCKYAEEKNVEYKNLIQNVIMKQPLKFKYVYFISWKKDIMK